MKKSTHEIIMTVAKVGRIVTKVLFVCSVVGLIIGVFGEIVVTLGFTDALAIGHFRLSPLVEYEAGEGIGKALSALDLDICYSISTLVVMKAASSYFALLEKERTPFTLTGTKSLFRLGILTMVLPTAMGVAAEIIRNIRIEKFEEVTEAVPETGASIVTGLLILALSLVCRYGAELIADRNSQENEAAATEIDN